MRIRGRLVAALGAALTLAPAAASAQFVSLETPDLRLLYNRSPHNFLAPHTARCFENSMRFHRSLFGYTPSEKVNVILDDISDFGNAGVWVSPRNSMAVHIAPVNFVYETNPSNERINFTMNHEIVHVLALDKAAGSDKLFRALFHGKVRETSEHPETMLYSYLTLPRRAAPRWYHEGAAVFFETWMAGGIGRAQGPYDEMVFRAKVHDGTRIYDPLGLESEGTKSDFQAGVNSYLYGTRFMDYLAFTYSPESIVRWVNRTPGSKRYFASQFHQVYGRPLDQAWSEWIAWEREFQRANLDSIHRYPTTPYRDLTDKVLGSVSRACFDSASGTVYAALDYPGTVAYIGAISIDGGSIRNLHDVKGPALYFVSSIAYDQDTKTLFYTADNNEWRDLCSLDPVTRKSRVLIRDARIGDLVFNRADRSLWGVRHFNGFSTLVRLPHPYSDWNQVFSWPYGQDLYDIDISPDGTRLCGSLAEASGRQTLRLWNVARLMEKDTTSTTLYDFGNAIPTSFVFSPDGSRLYGSSYYTGVSNIFRYDLAADSMEVVSNCETGFFRPLPVPGDSLIVFRFTGEGFVPAMIEPKPLQDVSAIQWLGAQIAEKHPIVKSWVIPSPLTVNIDSLQTSFGEYRSLSHLALTTLYPVVEGYKQYTAVGLRVNLSDPVAFHSIEASASYSPAEGLPAKERSHLALVYRHFDWTAKFHWNRASFYDLVGPTKEGRKGVSAQVGCKKELIRDAPRALDLTLGAGGYAGLEVLPYAQNVTVTPGFDKLIEPYAQLTYRNMRASIGAVEFEKGYKWQIGAATNVVRFEYPGHAAWQGFTLARAGLDFGFPLPIRNSSIWLRTAAGYSPGDREEPFANFFFGGFGNNWVDYQEPKRYRDMGSFPGVEIDEVAGTNFGKAILDWNLPPLRFRRVGTPAFYATWARVSLFGSLLATNIDSDEDRRTLGDAGAQLDIRFILFAQQNLTLSLGYAQAFEENHRKSDESMISLKIL